VFKPVRLLAVLAVTATTLVVAGAGTPATGFLPARWTGSWGTALTAASATNTNGSLAGFTDQSVRMIVRTSVGGEKVRIRVSNAFGVQAITVGHATVGVPTASGSPELVAGSIKELTFNGGSETVTIYKGGEVLSDPVDFNVASLSELAVTLYFPTATGATSFHWTSRQTSYIYAGDQAENPAGAGNTAAFNSFYFLSAVDVASRTALGSVVVLGDSISDGFNTTLNGNKRWPDALASRIVGTAPSLLDPGVLNQGLSGNQITDAGAFIPVGTNALSRLDSDVYGQTGVRSVIVELGINDLQIAGHPADRIIGGLRQLVAQLEEKGLRVLVCTLGPFEGFPSWTADREVIRNTVNAFIRSEFDHVVDMDAVLRDPAAPSKVRADYDSGDHIHPNDVGSAAVAAAVPLWLL
jgi:lysophospholipase L1-like esterase